MHGPKSLKNQTPIGSQLRWTPADETAKVALDKENQNNEKYLP
jgi:hypothetical protein